MKHKNLLVTLALCALIQVPLCLGSEAPQAQQSFLNRYAFSPIRNLGSAMSQKASSAYTTTRDYAASWVPQSIKDTVNSWSTKKKMAVATAILVALAGIYKRDVLMEWAKNVISGPISQTEESTYLSKGELAELGFPSNYTIKRSILSVDLEYYQRKANEEINRRTQNQIKHIKLLQSENWNPFTWVAFKRNPLNYYLEENKRIYSGENATTDEGIAFWRALKELGLN